MSLSEFKESKPCTTSGSSIVNRTEVRSHVWPQYDRSTAVWSCHNSCWTTRVLLLWTDIYKWYVLTVNLKKKLLSVLLITTSPHHKLLMIDKLISHDKISPLTHQLRIRFNLSGRVKLVNVKILFICIRPKKNDCRFP